MMQSLVELKKRKMLFISIDFEAVKRYLSFINLLVSTLINSSNGDGGFFLVKTS